jgi:hypothetical protein
MTNKLAGAILLTGSGLVAAIGEAGLKIASAILLAGYYAGNRTGESPTEGGNYLPQLIIVIAVVTLASFGIYCLLKKDIRKHSDE